MNSKAVDLSQVVQDAVDVGSLDQSAKDAASRAVTVAQGVDTGISVNSLEGPRAFLVNILVDDSGSMQGTEATVRRAISLLLQELSEALDQSEEVFEVLVTISFLNRGLVQPYCRVDEVTDLSDANHNCDGGTPLFSRSNEVLGALLTKVSELKASGRTAQTFNVIISDGQAGDGGEIIGGDGETRTSNVSNCSQLISGLTATKQHIVCGVSIGSGADSTFRQMGIPEKWILHPDRDSYAFESAMRQVSRASRAASQGAGAFRTTADGGFR
ncbi:MAG TPA: hypothetical protein PKA63_02470 [Oligoflexia bacterium]|nr:hypothetical protein [Oligoflexia bacterium]HMP47516.1 hypothetical protein [Oligoflexia bacterium]